MQSQLSTIPDDFGIGSKDILIHFYSNNRSSVNNKVVFTRNMFCLLQHGVKEVKTAEGKEIITSRELLILTGGSTLMSESIADNGKYEAILIFFSNQTLIDFCAKQQLTVHRKNTSASILKISRDEFLENYCQSLKLLRTNYDQGMSELKVQEILSYLRLAYPEAFQQLLSQALGMKTGIKLKQVVELNSNRGLTIEELAFLCDMSVSTFKRHFAAIYHVSPQKYFTRIKMEQAKVLLSLKHRPSEIYPELGYENLAAFSTEFKKYSGVSPRQFQDEREPLKETIERLA